MTDHKLTLNDDIEPEDEEPVLSVGDAVNAEMSITDNVHIVLRGPDGEIKHEFRGEAV